MQNPDYLKIAHRLTIGHSPSTMIDMNSLFHIDQGRGDPLILLHSGGMNHQEWTPQTNPLSRRFRVIVPDQPGHGQSPMMDTTLRIHRIGQSVIALMDQLNIEKTHLVGSSMGGAVALWMTLNHPERIKKLVVYRIGYRKNDILFAETRLLGQPEYWQKSGLERHMSRIHTPQGGDQAWKTVIQRVSEALNPNDSDHDYSPHRLSEIKQPTLIIVGDRDPLVPLEQALDMYHHIPNAALWVLPNASHVTATNTWRSDSLTLELSRFLQRRE